MALPAGPAENETAPDGNERTLSAVPATLRAGRLSLRLGEGVVRHIAVDGIDIVQQIYGAVRGPSWETIPPVFRLLRIDDSGSACAADFVMEHRWGDVGFTWLGSVRGDESSRLTFTFTGRALSRFPRNRIGLCLLSPLSCAGIECAVTHADGSVEKGTFPAAVAPHQPFLSIKGIRYRLAGLGEVDITFAGDEFEMEDQRNWTDGSFKTYCTPLALPLPVGVKPGDVVEQSIIVSFTPETSTAKSPRAADTEDGVALTDSAELYRLPKLGATWADRDPEDDAVALLSRIGPAVVAVSADANVPDGAARLAARAAASAEAGADTLVSLRLGEAADPASLEKLLSVLPADGTVGAALLPDAPHLLTDPKWTRPLLAAIPDGMPRGVGVSTFFAELNRNRPDGAAADFLMFSANPQVHAFDDEAIMENLEGLRGALRDGARTFAGPAGTVVAPLTLTNIHLADSPQAADDPRQQTAFAAAWATGAVRAVSEGGADICIFFDRLFGGLGLALAAAAGGAPGPLFPVFHLLEAVFPYSGGTLRPLRGGPEGVGGYRLGKDDRQEAILVYNLRDRMARARISPDILPGRAAAWMLDDSPESGWTRVEDFRSSGGLALPPYGVGILRPGVG